MAKYNNNKKWLNQIQILKANKCNFKRTRNRISKVVTTTNKNKGIFDGSLHWFAQIKKTWGGSRVVVVSSMGNRGIRSNSLSEGPTHKKTARRPVISPAAPVNRYKQPRPRRPGRPGLCVVFIQKHLGRVWESSSRAIPKHAAAVTAFYYTPRGVHPPPQ